MPLPNMSVNEYLQIAAVNAQAMTNLQVGNSFDQIA
jgi:hypothetical protein